MRSIPWPSPELIEKKRLFKMAKSRSNASCEVGEEKKKSGAEEEQEEQEEQEQEEQEEQEQEEQEEFETIYKPAFKAAAPRVKKPFDDIM